jgi:hypothetical protein
MIVEVERRAKLNPDIRHETRGHDHVVPHPVRFEYLEHARMHTRAWMRCF